MKNQAIRSSALMFPNDGNGVGPGLALEVQQNRGRAIHPRRP